MKQYCIKNNYTHRYDNKQFDDTKYTDSHQKEVYEWSEKLATQHNFTSIADIGTGSGYKLLKHFKHLNTLGIDLPDTVRWLNATYPNKLWSDKFEPVVGYDMIIASDVIEHIFDPDTLLDLIEKFEPKLIVLSTPDRDLLKSGQDGPPLNEAHVREWNSAELIKYISAKFKILNHKITNTKQATQTIIAKLK
jgi:hypothetical protein